MGRELYDVVIVGSGATGGWAAKALTAAGLDVALLDAGPLFANARTAGYEHLVERQPIQQRCGAFGEHTRHFFVDDVDNPYSGDDFTWIRSRHVGGRMLLWAGVSLRMSDLDFKAASRDGHGMDWPIGYADLAPFYDEVEAFFGVEGTTEGIPQLPDGTFLPAPSFTERERAFRDAITTRFPERRFIAQRIAMASHAETIGQALRTGHLALRPDTVVSHVLVDRSSGHANGVAFVDRVSKRSGEIRGRIVVLAASTIETTRILLASTSTDHPHGIGGSSGVLGRYLMDHFLGAAVVPKPPAGDKPVARARYIPRFRNVDERDPRFLRGYGVQCTVTETREAASLGLFSFGEVLPNPENRVTLDPTRTDAWGLPVAKIAFQYGDNERAMCRDAAVTLREMADAVGIDVAMALEEMAPPGIAMHEVGTARMGADARTSVLDPYNECWDVRSLFVVDGAAFTSAGTQNPTLTMMALAGRACATIIERFARGEKKASE